MRVSDAIAGRVLCWIGVAGAVLAHLTQFYIWSPIPAALFGAAAACAGAAGMMLCLRANRTHPERSVSRLYFVLATLCILAGLFYGSIIGPLIVFFPKI